MKDLSDDVTRILTQKTYRSSQKNYIQARYTFTSEQSDKLTDKSFISICGNDLKIPSISVCIRLFILSIDAVRATQKTYRSSQKNYIQARYTFTSEQSDKLKQQEEQLKVL